jgi:iron complex transport system permease protein
VKRFVPLLLMLLLTALLVLIAPFFGVIHISLDNLVQADRAHIFWSVRVPRVLLAFFVGAVLASCGYIYQAIFRNPLASPYTLGVSSGAAVGATIAMMLPAIHYFGGYGTSLGGVLGALVTIGVIMALGFMMRGDVSMRLLLAGVVLSFFLSSIVLFLQYIADASQIMRMTRWLMGSMEVVGYETVIVIAVISLLMLVVGMKRADELTLMSIDTEYAKTKGVAVEQIMYEQFFMTSLAIGLVVSCCGPIGFIGIAVPYIARGLLGYHLRYQLFISYLAGGCLLLLCDTFARVVIAPAEIPVGVITALLASPWVLLIIVRRGRFGTP